MYIIEVRRRNAELADAMAQMRTWLDNQAIEPVLFEIGFLPCRETRFRVQFRKRGDAVMFAASFDVRCWTPVPLLPPRESRNGKHGERLCAVEIGRASCRERV